MAQLSPNVGSGGAIGIGAFMNEQPLVRGISNVVGSLGGLTSALTLAGAATAGLITQDAIQEVTKYEEELADLAKILGNRDIAHPIAESIAELSTQMPIARQELSAVAEQAVRFGIRGRENILEFTEVVAQAAVATDASASQAAESLVKLAAITQTPISEVRNLANVLNELSNTAATSFSELVESAGQLAPVLSRMDVPTEDIFALAAATNEVNISVRRGARRLRSFFQGIRETDRLDAFARLIGRNTEELEKMIDSEEGALKLFVNVAQLMQDGGKDARRLSNAFNRAAEQGVGSLSQNLFALFEHLQTAREEMEGGTSLVDEYAQRVNTAAAKQQLLSNRIDEAQRVLGKKLLPKYKATLDVLIVLADVLDNVGRTGRFDQIFAPQVVESLRDELDLVVQSQTEWNDKLAKAPGLLGTLGSLVGPLMGQIADAFGEGSESAREALEENIFSQIIRVPEELRGDFRRRLENLLASFNQLGAEVRQQNLGRLLDAIAKIAQQLRQAGAAADEEIPKLPAEFRIATGEVVRFSEAQGKLIERFREQTEEMNRTDEELLKLRLNYENLDEAEQRFVDGLIQSRREAVELRQELEKMGKPFGLFVSNLLGFEQPMGRLIQTYVEGVTKGLDYVETLIAQNIELKKGALAAEIYRIKQRGMLAGMEKMAIELAKQNHQLEKEEDLVTDAASAYDRLQDRIADLTFQTQRSQLNLLEDSVQELSQSFMDFIEAAVTGSERLEDALVRMFTSIAETISERLLQGMLLDFFVSLGIFGIGAGSGLPAGVSKVGEVGHTFPGAARGGFFTAGQGVIVGEQGPELFVPRVAGTVVPNDQVGGGKTVNINVHNSFDVNAVDGKSVKRMLDENMEHIASGTTRVISQHQVLRRELLS